MPKKHNVHSIAHLLDLMVIPDDCNVTVEVRGKRLMTPDQARALAVEILYAAAEAEGDELLGDFGYNADDSLKLGQIYSLIDEELGWEDDEQEISGDYQARVKQVGRILRQKHLRVVR